MDHTELIYLSKEDVLRCGAEDWEAACNDVKHALTLHASEQSVLPAKVTVKPSHSQDSGIGTHYIAMPAFLGGDVQMAGLKWVRVGGSNSAPSIAAIFLLADHENGNPVALMDATLLTGIRTAAVTVVSAEQFADSDAETLAVIGAGMQSRMHLQALTHSFPRLKEIRICGRRQEKARHLTDEYGNRFKGRALAVRDAETAVRGADIVVTATTTDKPIIEKDWLKDGVFYAQIGSHECTFEAAAAFDRIYVDDWQQLLRRGVQTLAIMANQGLWSEERLTGTLGERLLGKVPGRESKREKIMFSSIGLGVTDIVMASRIYRTAVAKRIGNKVPL